MATLRILVPDGTTNYVKNPSMRYDTTGYTANGATVTRTLDRARFGISSLKIVTNGLALNEGAFYRVSWLSGITSPLTGSVYLRGSGKVRIRLVDNFGGGTYVSKAKALSDDRWTRFEVSGRCDGSNDIRLYVESSDTLPKAITFYADGFQIETKPYATTYADGEQAGCQWNIMAHNSISIRDPYTRAGGKWFSLNEYDDLYFTTFGGLGVPPIQNNTQSYADAPGSYHQNSKILDRVINILFHIKKEDFYSCPSERSLEHLHSLRQTLFEIIKPDKTTGDEEFLMEYQDGDYPVYFRARYESGLEGNWDVRNQWVSALPIRFLAVSPFIVDDSYETKLFSFRERQTVNYVMQRINGVWSEMNGGMDAVIYDFKVGKRGEIIACGEFTRSNNKTTAVDPQIYSNHVAYWDGTQWHSYGSGANGIINSIAIAPNGDIYVTGEFTSIGGVAANRIAYWNGSQWNALGTGLGNGAGFTIAVAPNGHVYVGGSFTLAGGITLGYCALYFNNNWHAIGLEGGLNGSVYSIAIMNDGSQVYFGGSFTDEYTSPATLALNYVALYDVGADQFYEMGDGFNALVRKVIVMPSGRVYACGEFTETGAVVPDTILYIGYWNGAAWYSLGIGANDIVRNMDVSPLGQVLAVGDFTRIGSEDAAYLALWNNSTWVNLDVSIQNACHAVKWDAYENVFVSPNGTMVDFAAITYVTNVGTAEVNPKMYFVGPCTLRWLENQTSKKRVYANLEILSNEEVVIDFGKGTITSTVRGDISYAILPGSDLRAWTLIPGENKLSALIVSDIGALAQISYSPLFWSADSTSRQEDI